MVECLSDRSIRLSRAAEIRQPRWYGSRKTVISLREDRSTPRHSEFTAFGRKFNDFKMMRQSRQRVRRRRACGARDCFRRGGRTLAPNRRWRYRPRAVTIVMVYILLTSTHPDYFNAPSEWKGKFCCWDGWPVHLGGACRRKCNNRGRRVIAGPHARRVRRERASVSMSADDGLFPKQSD